MLLSPPTRACRAVEARRAGFFIGRRDSQVRDVLRTPHRGGGRLRCRRFVGTRGGNGRVWKKDQKLTVGFETPTAEAHDTRIVRMTMSGLRRAVAARLRAIIDGTDNDGPLKELWDAVDCGGCDNFRVSGADDAIMLHCGAANILGGERPVFALDNLVRETVAAR